MTRRLYYDLAESAGEDGGMAMVGALVIDEIKKIEIDLPNEARQILDEEYNVEIQGYYGEIMISTKSDHHDINSFLNLGQLMMKEEIKFSYQTESFIMESNDFLELCQILIKEV